ncbi:uncharacterized protein LOC133203371 [Saccostrea echinata]|uniref:uncharacterized protein LOC133203371 n=1 Tax=Saccostrea echinata TaxID=191078 RepID=UPI002A83ABB5|nr:uncharacterized protein LOC133203371 [Saccostrea echinata]
MGDYSVWKTKISDQFSTLTDDELFVLFCFLCSDSGPPDFTDTEWLDLLNKIRLRVYGKENPVTSEKAQQTLDRLKSRDYLWEDVDMITEDTKDETMYRIASIYSVIPFYYSSYDTASVYLRSERYNRKPGEKCVSGGGYCDYLLIERLQMNILTHVTMEDTTIYDKIHQILNVSNQKLNDSEDKREEFLMDLRREGEAVHYRGRTQDSVDHVTWLWRDWLFSRPDIVRSCIGLHPHWDIYIIDKKAYRKTSTFHNYSEVDRSLLYSLLLCDKYTDIVNGEVFKSILVKIRENYFQKLSPSDAVKVKHLQHVMKETQNGSVTFVSDDIRHDVMYAFVTECLVEDSDLESFMTTASRDVISDYCRSWDYERSEGERCLYVPKSPAKMYDLFIDKLQLDIITHCTVCDWGIHESISKRLNIPEEILGWDIHARERFVKNFKQKRVKMFRARGMIVGCAGAGKTTLLRRLHGSKRTNKDSVGAGKRIFLRKSRGRKRTDKDNAGGGNSTPLRTLLGGEGTYGNTPTKTTVGLEVHEDLFIIEDNKLKDFSTRKANSENQYLDNNVVSMTDFAGQVAYYACHQVYLSRRAFYIVVVDMSKNLKEESRMYDKDRHDPTGSLFHSWTYGDYFHFWLQTINTYCKDGITQGDPRDTTTMKDSMANINFHPVILIASHKDQLAKPLPFSKHNRTKLLVNNYV